MLLRSYTISRFREEYPEKQRVLLEILRAVGYNIPPSISDDKEER